LPQGHRAAVLDRGFEGNILTSDPDRFATMMALVQTEPALGVGAPTVGWMHAAFRAMAPLNDLEFCRHLTTPMLMVVPGADRVISVAAMERLAGRLKSCALIRIPHARHEVMMERDDLRNQFWAAFDAFVPGTGLADLRPAARARLAGRN
jgi:lysophospholipase